MDGLNENVKNDIISKVEKMEKEKKELEKRSIEKSLTLVTKLLEEQKYKLRKGKNFKNNI